MAPKPRPTDERFWRRVNKTESTLWIENKVASGELEKPS